MAKIATAKAVYSSEPSKSVKIKSAEKVVFTPDSDAVQNQQANAFKTIANAEEANNIDVDALDKEIKDLESKRDAAKPIYDSYKVKSAGARGDQIEKVNNARDSEIKNVTGNYTYDELNNLITEKKAQWVIADRRKRLKNLSSVINPEAENYDKDFEKYKQSGNSIDYKTVGKDNTTTISSEHFSKKDYRITDDRAAAIALAEHNGVDKSVTGGDWYDNVKKYRFLKPEEFDLLAYYMGRDKETGGNQTKEYLDLMEETLNQRQGESIYEDKLKGNTALEILYGVPVGLDQFANGVKNLLDTESDYIPASAVQNAGQLARSDLSDVGFIGGLSLGQIGYDILSTTANMAPSILVSTAVGMINPTAGAWAGGALMGASSAGNAYQEALNNGMEKSQARVYSTLVGASEAAMSATVSKVFGGKVLSGKIENAISGIDKGLIRFAANYGWAFASEGLEEAAQEILTPLFENIALGYNKNGFDDIDWSEVAYSFLLGGLSGGAFDIIGSGVKRVTGIAQIKQDYNTPQKVQNLLKLALSMPTDSKANTLAQKYNTEVESKGKLAANKIYNLAIASENFINDRLIQLGEKNDTPAVASAVVKKLVGNELSVSEIELLSKSSYGQEVLNATISSEQNNVIAEPETSAENQPLQSNNEGGIINQGGEEDGRISNQGAVSGSVEEEIYTRRESQMGKNNETINGYVTGGKGEILSGSTGKTPRRIRINHTKNSSVTFTEGTADGTDGYKAYTAFANVGIKAIYCQGPIERTVNGVTVTRTEAFTAPDGTVYISSESTLPPKQTFDHEKVHVADKTNNPAYSDYESVLCENAMYSSSAYSGLAEEINKIYFNGKYDIEDVDSYPIFMREIAAYVNQFVLSDPEFAEKTFGGMFSDWGEVVEAVNKFNTDMGADFTESANFMPDGENEGGRADGEIADFGGIDTSKVKHLDKAQQDEITDIGKKLGRKVVYEDFYSLDKFKGKKKIPDGYIDKDGNVHINYYAKRPVYFLFKHEITHYSKRNLASYNDFMNLVIDSNAFKDWLNKKGYSSIDALKTEIMDTYGEVEGFNETKCYDEILANFVGEYLFGGENAINQNLIDALEPKQKKTFMDVIKGIIDYLKSKFQKNKPIQTEIDKIENEFIKVYKEAVEVKTDESVKESYSFAGYADDGKGRYKSNFPQGTPKKAKGERILKYIQEVWSKKPIRLKIKEDGITRYIEAKFDPTYDETKHIFNDATKLMGGNRHGTSSEQRVTLDLADDYYQIASEASYNYSKDEIGKQNPAHEDVKKWHYFVNDIYFAEYDSEEYTPYRVTINVKEKSDGEYVYSFSAEKQRESDTPRTLHAAVNDGNNPDANVKLSNNKLTQDKPIVKNNISKDGDFYSIPSTTSAESLLERYENGDITRQEYLDMLKGKKTLNPVEIANLKEEDANTAPPLQRKKGEAKGDKQSKFYGSIQGSELFGEEFKQEAASDEFIEKYKSITNKETLQTAAKELEEGGKEYVEKWWAIKPERANLIDTTVGFILMDRYQRAGKIEQAIAVAEKVREFGTASGQQVQIFSIIGRFDPDMMVAYAKKELSQAFETMVKGKTNKWIDKNKDKFQLTEEDIEFIRRRTLQAAMFEDGARQKAVALAEIQKTLQDKIPPESGDSIRALQRISMLLNPKTNERNIIGNAGMVGVFVASDVFGSGIDKIISQKTGVRTTGNFDIKSVSGIKKGLYESYDDFKRGIRTKQEELNRFDINASRSSKNFNENGGGIFGTKVLKKQLNDVAKVLNKIDNFTSFCLEAGDRPFFEMWYMNSLNTQLKLNNLEIPTPEMLEIAKEEALKRTWQDDNVYTRAVSNLKKNVNIIHIPGTSYGLGDFIFKFVKTPTNLAKAIVEFSPLGFAGATSNAIKLKNAIETNQFNAQLQKEFVRSTSNAITGTLVYALVAIGAALGVVKLSGDGDEDKDVSNYEKYIMGIPPYSIEFLGANMTYDWMQPFGSVLATVADFMQTKKEEPDLKTSAVIWEAIKAGGKTFTKQSFLQSMYDFFSQDDIVEGISSLVLSEPAAFIPQAFSQLASYLDKYRRTTYDATNAFQTSINKMIAKIPGLRTKLPKQVNVLGEDVKNTQYLNPWEAFASPWNTYPKSSNEIVGEIYDLYKKTGEDSVMPRTAPNYLTVKGNKVTFSPEEKAEFQRDMGRSSAEMLAILFDDSEYKKLSDNEKADVVSKIYEFAYAKSKSAIKYDYETLSAMAGEKKNGDPVLSESDYKKLPEKARQIIAQEYFLSKAEVRYIDNYNMLIQSFIKKVKE